MLPTGEIVPPDWSQFIPDAILTLVTGAAVGWALWRLQSSAETRAEKRVALASWSVARSRVAWALPKPFEENFDRGDSWLGVWIQFESLEEVGATLAVGEWSNAVPDNTELQLTRDLLVDSPNLRRLAVELSDLLEQTMLSQGLVAATSTSLYVEQAWITLRGLDLSSYRRAYRWETRTDIVTHVLTDPGVAERTTAYMALENRVRANAITLSGLLAN